MLFVWSIDYNLFSKLKCDYEKQNWEEFSKHRRNKIKKAKKKLKSVRSWSLRVAVLTPSPEEEGVHSATSFKNLK